MVRLASAHVAVLSTGPFTPEDLDRIEQFYRKHNAPSQVDLCPLHGPEVFEMFCASRLQGNGAHVFGMLDSSPELKGIVERAAVLRR